MRAIGGAGVIAVALTTLACQQPANTPSGDSPEISLYTEPGSAEADRLDQDLRTFARTHDLRLTATHFPTSPTKEVVYRVFGEGYEIMVVEPFEEGQYRANFYASSQTGIGRGLLLSASADFRKEVLGFAAWIEQ